MTGAELIAGACAAPDVAIAIAEDPNTAAAVGALMATSSERVDTALAAAHEAWSHGDGAWSAQPFEARRAGLLRLADELDARAEALARLHAAEIGIPIATASLFAGGPAEVVREVVAAAADLVAPQPLDAPGRRVERLRLPLGPAALMCSWNAPAFLAATKLANALAAGCPAILKPSELTRASTALLVDALLAADLGPGAAQVVCGGADVGGQLARDPRTRVISYTGGSAGGRAVAEAAFARMPALQLELSGSNPALVVKGADLEAAARELAHGATVLNGQWCEAPRRVLVHADDHDTLASLLLDELAATTVGHSLDPTTDVGPLASRGQFERVSAQLDALRELGDARAAHATVPEQGFFVSPTVVAGLPLNAVREEIFGPILAVMPYREVAQALATANGLGDGLAAYVFAADRTDAFALGSRLHAGEVRLGGVRLLDLAPGSAQSFWGTSGLGGHGRREMLEAHLGTRVVGEEDFELPL